MRERERDGKGGEKCCFHGFYGNSGGKGVLVYCVYLEYKGRLKVVDPDIDLSNDQFIFESVEHEPLAEGHVTLALQDRGVG